MCVEPMAFDPADKDLVMAVLTYRAESATRLTAARDAAFPSHIGHTVTEDESVYRGGRLVAISSTCSCGYMLEIGVEFFHGYRPIS